MSRPRNPGAPHGKLAQLVAKGDTEAEAEQIRAKVRAQRAEDNRDIISAAVLRAGQDLRRRLDEILADDDRYGRRMVTSISVAPTTSRFLMKLQAVTGMHWGKLVDLIALSARSTFPENWDDVDDQLSARTSLVDENYELTDEDKEMSAEDAIKEIDRMMAKAAKGKRS